MDKCRAEKIRQAAHHWNTELARIGAPKDAFIVQEVSEAATTLAGRLWVFEAPLPTRKLGTTQLGYYGDTNIIGVALITMSAEHCLLRTSIHELGHALGLQHAPAVCFGCIMRAHVPVHEGRLIDTGWLREVELRYVVNQMTSAGPRIDARSRTPY